VKVIVSRHEQQLSQAAHVGVVQKDSHDSGRDEQGQSTVRADVDESGHTHMGGRRLQGSSEYAAVPAWQVHEFPSGHTCGTGARMRLQPKSASGDLTWRMSSGVDASSNQKLVNVGSQWATTDVQELATPLKVVHDASCSNAPTLDLPLSTTVQTLAVSGTLTLGGADVATALQNACPSTRDTTGWMALNLFASQASADGTDPPRYKIQCGVVYLAGVSVAVSGSFSQAIYVVYSSAIATQKDMGFTVSSKTYGGGSPQGCTAQAMIRTDGYMIYGSNSCTMPSVSLYGISFPIVVT